MEKGLDFQALFKNNKKLNKKKWYSCIKRTLLYTAILVNANEII
jgi:hypothetical protein